jgi:hypothetical protein
VFNVGKCPKSDKVVSDCPTESFTAGTQLGSTGPKFYGVHILCPHCKTILGSSIDVSNYQGDLTKQRKDLGLPKAR